MSKPKKSAQNAKRKTPPAEPPRPTPDESKPTDPSPSFPAPGRWTDERLAAFAADSSLILTTNPQDIADLACLVLEARATIEQLERDALEASPGSSAELVSLRALNATLQETNAHNVLELSKLHARIRELELELALDRGITKQLERSGSARGPGQPSSDVVEAARAAGVADALEAGRMGPLGILEDLDDEAELDELERQAAELEREEAALRPGPFIQPSGETQQSTDICEDMSHNPGHWWIQNRLTCMSCGLKVGPKRIPHIKPALAG